MDKDSYIASLFNDIKNNIEFDSDVIALTTLLNSMLDFNALNSFFNWKYIIENYDIRLLALDIDFTPLYNDYLVKLIEKIELEHFFILVKDISKDKLEIIYASLFNIYSDKCFLYSELANLIKSKNNNKEKELIDIIIKESVNFPSDTFDKTEFLRRIILIHLDYKIIPIKLLKDITNIPSSSKEKAILKTLLIDYIN